MLMLLTLPLWGPFWLIAKLFKARATVRSGRKGSLRGRTWPDVCPVCPQGQTQGTDKGRGRRPGLRVLTPFLLVSD